MEPQDVVNIVIGVGVAGGVLGFLYFILNQLDSNATQAFLGPIASNWSKIVLIVVFGAALGYIIPQLKTAQK